jgi:anthranilate phosphoribosyltransferase
MCYCLASFCDIFLPQFFDHLAYANGTCSEHAVIMPTFFWERIISSLAEGSYLHADDAEWAMTQILTGDTPKETIKSFLLGVQARGETAVEIEAFLSAILAQSVPISVPGLVVDCVGTGGDDSNTFNISSAAAIIAHAAGARVVKHGARAGKSDSGSADVMEALGVNIHLNNKQVAECVEDLGIGFCFTPQFHPALGFADPARKELGHSSVFNILRPLANPAKPGAVAIGVSRPRMLTIMADVLLKRDVQGFLFRGDDGMDEISLCTTTTIIQINHGKEKIAIFDPRSIGVDYVPSESLKGGDPSVNASIIRSILAGEKLPSREIVLLNAAATIAAYRGQFWKSIEDQFSEAYAEAKAVVDSGAAMFALNAWGQYTQGFIASEIRA